MASRRRRMARGDLLRSDRDELSSVRIHGNATGGAWLTPFEGLRQTRETASSKLCRLRPRRKPNGSTINSVGDSSPPSAHLLKPSAHLLKPSSRLENLSAAKPAWA